MIKYILAVLAGLIGLTVPVQAGKYSLITILHTNDIHADVPNDLSRLSTLAFGIKAQMPNVLMLDAGDMIHGSAVEYYSGGNDITDVMMYMGYDAVTCGNHEFDFGAETVSALTQKTSYPFLAANINSKSDSLKIKPFTIIDSDGVKIAVMGLATLETVTLHWRSIYNYLDISDPIETAKQLIPTLREQADIVVVLSHLGFGEDKRLAKEVKGIDFIIGGHTHEAATKEWLYVGDTLVTQTGAHAKALGRIDLIAKTDDDGKVTVESVNGKQKLWNSMANPPLNLTYPTSPLVYPNEETLPDERVMDIYKSYKEQTDSFLSQTIGFLAKDMTQKETQSFCAEAVKYMAGADVGIIDNGSLTGSLRASDVTNGTMFNLVKGYTRQEIIVGSLDTKKLSNALKRFSKITYTRLGAQKKTTFAAQAYVMMEIMGICSDVEIISEHRDTMREALMLYAKYKLSRNI